MSQTLRIALLATHPGFTLSYGRVGRELGYALERLGHSVTWLGLPTPRGAPAAHRNALLLPTQNTPMAISQWLTAHQPDRLISVGDPWMFMGLPRIVQDAGVAWTAYFPVDGRPLPHTWHEWLHDCNTPVVYSHFAADVVEAAVGIRPNVAYHGVDDRVFRRLDKIAAKEKVGVAGHFVVGTVCANQQRKNIPALIEAFARFSHNKPDVLLYLHTELAGPCWDILELARHHHIEHLVHATLDYDAQRGISDDDLCHVYNAMDIFVLPTMAEGFGLPIVEAQACATPVLATDFSSCPELLPDDFCKLRVKAMLTMYRNIEQAVVDVDDIVDKLQTLYAAPSRLTELADKSASFAKRFTWDACASEVLAT